jgi:arginine N-succinyltransferase
VSFIIRAAGEADLQSLYEMAKRTGGGFTNLPPDKPALARKLAVSAEAFARDVPDFQPGGSEMAVLFLSHGRADAA